MASVPVSSYKIESEVVTLITSEVHPFSAGDYVSIRNVNSSVNGQYIIATAPSNTSITYEKTGASNIGFTNVNGQILYTSLNSSGKPAYVYDQSSDTLYQISGRVNTNGNYTWTGTHLYQAPVTMEDILVMSNISASVSASPNGGGYLYVEDGELKFKGGNGTITTIAPA